MKRLPIMLGGVASLVFSLAAEAAGPDPNWPCQQAPVATMTAAMIWDGPPIDNIGDWHAEPAVAALVAQIAPRNVSTQDGEAAIQAFLHDLHGDRKRLITLAFAGLLEETNDQRSTVISRIKDLAERQRNLSDVVARLTAEVDALPSNGSANSPEHTELLDRWNFATRAYTEMQRTMRYACEIPGQIDGRLGAFARALAAGLS